MSGEYGLLANASLIGVIIVCFSLFSSRKLEDSALVILMTGILFLPQLANIKIPFFPPLNRASLPYICIFIVVLFRRRPWVRQNRLGRGLDLLILVSMFGAIMTALGNPDPLNYGKYGHGTHLSGMTLKDGFAGMGDDLFFMGFPFVLGRLIVRDERLANKYLFTFAVGGLVYSLFIMVELRMSPQIHNWVYGYRARSGDFAQMIRSGGYRPSVFLPHALALVMLMFNSLVAAAILARNKHRLLGWSWRPFVLYLLVILALCKGTASLIYALVAVPLVLYSKPRTQLRLATLLSIVVLAYPALRGGDWFPTQTVLSGARMLGPDREESIAYRFNSEDLLLGKARQRVWFGWGPYNRNEHYEPIYGNKDAITDGDWIIFYGIRGAVGAVARYLVLVIPIWMARRALKRIPGQRERVVLAGTATMLAFSAIDLLPNAMFDTYPFFMAGALVGMTRVFTAPSSQMVPTSWDPGDEPTARPVDVYEDWRGRSPVG
jgi:hypothetical protein